MSAKIWRLSSVLVLSMLLSACGVTKWFSSDEKNQGKLPEPLTEITNEFKAKTVWKTGSGGADDDYTDLSLWLQGGSAFSVDADGRVEAFNAETGNSLWRMKVGASVGAGVGGGDFGTVLVGTLEGDIFALNSETGEIRWQKKVNSEILAPPVSGSNVAVVRTADGQISGLSLTDGTVLWHFQRQVPLLSLRGASKPIIVGDQVVVGYSNGKLLALSLANGSLLWEQRLAVPRGATELDRIVDIDATPVAKGGRIYVVAHNGRVAALAEYNGGPIWHKEMSSQAGLDAAPDEAVFVTDSEGYIWALADSTGETLWRQTRLLRRKPTAPVVFGNYLIVGDYDGYVHWLSRFDGHFVSRQRVSTSGIISKPLVVGDKVYITALDGNITVLLLP